MTEKDKKALELAKLMLGDPKDHVIAQWKTAQQMMAQLSQQMGKEMFEGHPDLVEELSDELDSIAITDEQWGTFWDDLGIGEMMEMFTTVYADVYTEDELDSLVEMCKMPAYKLMRIHNPEVTTKCNEISNRWMLNHSDKIMKAMENMDGNGNSPFNPFGTSEDDDI